MICILCVLVGCVGKSVPPRFYTLVALTEKQEPVAIDDQLRHISVGIGPVTLADYLGQSRIVTRTGSNTLEKAEFDQWSGSLEDNITNVLAENIGQLLGTPAVFLFPWRGYMDMDFQVIVDIVRLDGQLGGEVVLVSRWRLLDNRKKTLIANRRNEISILAEGSSYEAFVNGQSKILAKLSQVIVEAIRAANH